MTCTPTSSPTRRAADAPASVAAFTEPTSPRTMAVTRPASTFCQPTKTTFAVLTMASAASIIPIKPRVSIIPSASPISRFSLSANAENYTLEPAPATLNLRDQSGESSRVDRVAGKDRPRVLHAEMTDDDLADHVAEVGGHGEVASFVPLIDGEARPPAVDAAARDGAAD